YRQSRQRVHARRLKIVREARRGHIRGLLRVLMWRAATVPSIDLIVDGSKFCAGVKHYLVRSFKVMARFAATGGFASDPERDADLPGATPRRRKAELVGRRQISEHD